MSDWYVSSAAYAAISAFTPSGVYTVGNIVKPTSPALKAKWAFRCTTAGTASTEPAWPTADGATITTGGATFTNVTGQSTYFWAAAAGDIPTLLVSSPRFAAGDRIFVSSDHTETQTTGTYYGSGGSATLASNVGQILCVNRAGSTPPVAADLTTGAVVINNGTGLILEAIFPTYHYGITYEYISGSVAAIYFNQNGLKTTYLDHCQIWLNSATAGLRITSGAGACAVMNNTTVRFGATSHGIRCNGTYPLEIVWQNTPSAVVGATLPTTLFPLNTANQDKLMVTARGVDLSAITGTLVGYTGPGCKFLFDSCKIASGATRYTVNASNSDRDLVELVNCYDGTHFISESYQPNGTVTTEFTITLSGGATDDVGTFSHKMVSNTNIDKYVSPLTSFWMDVENTLVGSSKTATVEIVSSASLNNDDISLLLEYQGTASSSVASFVNSLPATVLTTNAAVTTSTATWNSLPSTPAKQKLQVTFTPQVAGRVRGQVRLGKASATVYVNPQVTIT